MGAQLALVHLARKANGPEPVHGFLASYLEHEPGVEHELVLLGKGYADEHELDPFRERLGGRPCRVLLVPDVGVDLTAYRLAAEALPHERCCFVNSHSRALVGDWLGLLDRALDEPDVGVAGASASWTSHRSLIAYQLGLAGPYASAFGDRRATVESLLEIERERDPTLATHGELRRRADLLVLLARHGAPFAPFPVPHLRTNAFLIGRTELLAQRGWRRADKRQAYRLESGRQNLTRQLERRGRRAVVCGADGAMSERERWPESNTFWQSDQEKLLVADNQTALYAGGDLERRTLLARMAWGERAAPAPARDSVPGS